MSFQDNRFPIILGATTAVLVGGLAYWGISSSGKYNEAKDEYDAAVSKLKSLTRGPAYPNADNVSAKEKAVSDYRASVEELQSAFDAYRVPEVENVGVDVFGDALRTAREELGAKFRQVGTEFPADTNLGLGVYTRETVNAGNTGILLYQLKAFENLFSNLADARIAELLNIHRPPLPEEEGKEVDTKGLGYRTHPIEIAFSCREGSLRSFISSLDDSEEFCYVIRAMRVQNERTDAPNAQDAKFSAAKPEAEAAPKDDDGPFGADFFEDFEEGEETADAGDEAVADTPPVDVESSDSGQILKQVLGDELLEVFMRIDVVQFLGPKPLPKG